MGTVEVDGQGKRIVITSHIITYGGAATPELTQQIGEEIETMWNEPQGRLVLQNETYTVVFRITAQLREDISELEVLQNTDPRTNYFRIETFARTSISFVDGLGCNTGYFLLENLYKGSTTAAHEYGHTLGLNHPRVLDIRGQGVPGIMYPRGTLVNPEYQYDPAVPAGQKGGTLHPMYRRVRQQDIQDLRLHRLTFDAGRAVLGDFTNIYHWNHAEEPPEAEFSPPLVG